MKTKLGDAGCGAIVWAGGIATRELVNGIDSTSFVFGRSIVRLPAE